MLKAKKPNKLEVCFNVDVTNQKPRSTNKITPFAFLLCPCLFFIVIRERMEISFFYFFPVLKKVADIFEPCQHQKPISNSVFLFCFVWLFKKNLSLFFLCAGLVQSSEYCWLLSDHGGKKFLFTPPSSTPSLLSPSRPPTVCWRKVFKNRNTLESEWELSDHCRWIVDKVLIVTAFNPKRLVTKQQNLSVLTFSKVCERFLK